MTSGGHPRECVYFKTAPAVSSRSCLPRPGVLFVGSRHSAARAEARAPPLSLSQRRAGREDAAARRPHRKARGDRGRRRRRRGDGRDPAVDSARVFMSFVADASRFGAAVYDRDANAIETVEVRAMRPDAPPGVRSPMPRLPRPANFSLLFSHPNEPPPALPGLPRRRPRAPEAAARIARARRRLRAQTRRGNQGRGIKARERHPRRPHRARRRRRRRRRPRRQPRNTTTTATTTAATARKKAAAPRVAPTNTKAVSAGPSCPFPRTPSTASTPASARYARRARSRTTPPSTPGSPSTRPSRSQPLERCALRSWRETWC